MFNKYFLTLKSVCYCFGVSVAINGNKKNYVTTVGNVIQKWNKKFGDTNISEPKMSAESIVGHVVGIKNLLDIHKSNRHLNEEEIEKIDQLCECRLARMPLQYIIGEWDFRELTLKLFPPVFIPRPETEMIIDIILENTADLRISLEIGCGSGAISIALLNVLKDVHGIAIDQSEMAYKVTKINAERYGLHNRLQIFQQKLQNDGTFEKLQIPRTVDVVISNPPYIYSTEIPDLDPEIKLYEDLRALDGGVDGLQIIKAILLLSSRILPTEKSCFLEIHHNHLKPIANWLNENKHLNLSLVKSFKDYCNFDRFVQVRKL